MVVYNKESIYACMDVMDAISNGIQNRIMVLFFQNMYFHFQKRISSQFNQLFVVYQHDSYTYGDSNLDFDIYLYIRAQANANAIKPGEVYYSSK